MGKTIKTPDSANDFKSAKNSAWRSCVECGAAEFKSIVYFDSGSVAPTVGETITGATSGNTGVVEAVYIRSGSYATLDAAGCFELTSPTGYELENYTIFQDNEDLNGSIGGANISTVNGVGSVVINGIMYPEQDMVEYQGKWYCNPHFVWRFQYDWDTENIFKSSMEKERSY